MAMPSDKDRRPAGEPEPGAEQIAGEADRHGDRTTSHRQTRATALALEAFPDATFVELADDDLGGHALAYALTGWEIFPLRGKVPLIPKRAGGRGVLDATSDLATIGGWWDRWPGANIGGRVPQALVVLDVDPRHGGDRNLAELEAAQGVLPATQTSVSGRGDGGRHMWWLHPGGKLTTTRLPDGLDVKTHRGYVVLPPSVHPASGQPYRWVDVTPVAMPTWLIDLLRPPPPRPRLTRPARRRAGASIADAFTAATTWGEVLGPHGWVEVGPDRWCHPAATHPTSATVTHDCLFVYSTGTPFETTEAGAAHDMADVEVPTHELRANLRCYLDRAARRTSRHHPLRRPDRHAHPHRPAGGRHR
jgi:Bifunctional DNA primase/polymerase, N-terminal